MPLVRPCSVHAGDGLEQLGFLDEAVEVERLGNGSVEAGEQHRLHDHDGERIVLRVGRTERQFELLDPCLLSGRVGPCEVVRHPGTTGGASYLSIQAQLSAAGVSRWSRNPDQDVDVSDESAPADSVEAKRHETTRAMAEFNADQRPQRESWLTRHGQVPERLYHYTTINGLMGILPNSSIWASDARFMNDSSELSYATDLIVRVVDEELEKVADPALKELFELRRGFTAIFDFGYEPRPFIACFCEDGDLLSQWRGYARGQAGISLGLRLPQFARSLGRPGPFCERCCTTKTNSGPRFPAPLIGGWLLRVASCWTMARTLESCFPTQQFGLCRRH